jgi:ribosomal protein L24
MQSAIHACHLQLNAVCVSGVNVKREKVSASEPTNDCKPDIDYVAEVQL